MLSVKWQQFCLGLNVLGVHKSYTITIKISWKFVPRLINYYLNQLEH